MEKPTAPITSKSAESQVHELSQNRQSVAATAKEPLKDRLWLFEVFAWFLCAIGLAGIIIILAVTEGKPMPSWSHTDSRTGIRFTVTINSVISLFGTLVKSTLLIPVVASLHQLKWIWFKEERPLSHVTMFESAGKGPLGSVMLIWTTRGRALAVLGAFIIIASLGIDFTLQSLVTYPLRASQVGSGFIARSNSYTGYRASFATELAEPEVPMMAAIYRGIYNPDSADSFLPNPNCPTGNCTWFEPYTSLGVCSRCTDVTDLLDIQCSDYQYIDHGVEASVPLGGRIPYCNYTLPNEQRLSGLEQLGVLVQLNSTSASSDTWFGKSLASHLTSFTIIRATPNISSDEVDGTPRQWLNYIDVNATECGLDFCVKKYTGLMDKTIFSEEILDTFSNTTDTGINDGTSAGAPEFFINTPSDWSNHSKVAGADTFEIDPFTIIALRHAFTPLGEQARNFWSGSASNPTADLESSTTDIAAVLRSLDQNDTIALVASVAASMTKRMREAPGSGTFGLGANSTGAMFQHVPYVNVRWGWIAFPVTLVALALVFLLITIVQNAREGAMLWKSNSLANFYHPLTKDGRDELQIGQNAEQAVEIAEKMKVKWARTDAGVRLVQRHEN